jgi:streptomycin 6-kinase
MKLEMFNEYINRWNLVPDGDPFLALSSKSWLLPVIYQNIPAMLKVAGEDEERLGGLLMVWWNGSGAAKVFVHDSNAIVMERALGKQSLVEMVKNGEDDQASRIICEVAAKLHTVRQCPHPRGLLSLESWFKELEPIAQQQGGILKKSASVARELLNHPQEVVVLHGDLHHENVLDFGEHGWLAIDPKRLIGDRCFDYANILRNPEFDIKIATAPGRFATQVSVITAATGLERPRLLQWILAFTGLSAAWFLTEGIKPELDLAIAELAASELANNY